MSGLETLSLAANIVEIISFAGEITRLCRSVYKHGRLESQLGILAVSLEAVAKEAQVHQTNLVSKTDLDLSLEEMASKCQVAARELGEEVEYLHKGSKQGDLTAAVRVAVKVNWRKRRLDRLEATLAKFQAAMQSHLLYRLCKEQDVAIREQHVAADSTNATLQQLIAAYSSGQTNISLNLRTEANRTQDHVSFQSKNLERCLTAHVTESAVTLEQSIATIAEQSSSEVINKLSGHLDNLKMERAVLDNRQRLLESLKFAEMNGRINAVEDAHSGTFEWIFDESSLETPEESDYMFDSSSNLNLSVSEDVAGALMGSQTFGCGVEEDHFRSEETDNASESESYSSEDEWRPSEAQSGQGWDDITEWLKSESKFYWISGHPGSGKSTLVKFLVSHRETRCALHAWRTQAVVLHHFFWKPGSSMQNSIRGMLCTLAYQLLSKRPIALDICAREPSLLTKATCSDWSLKQLQTLVLVLLKDFAPVCIFVDGLDEAPELDYCRGLLDLLHYMASLPNVKICAASRPESALKRRLESHPHLRLQDLTKRDLRAFANAAFESERLTMDRKQRAKLQGFVKLLVRRAEGVFLWLRLVVADTLRDLASGYSLQELHERVGRLPHMLTALYHDMWSRLNTDKSEDHRAGAEILNFALVAKQYEDLEITTLYGNQAGSGFTGLYLTDLLAILRPGTPHSRPSAINFDDKEVARQLQVTARDIRNKTAGLLDISLPLDQTRESGTELIDATVDFIHRSAFDFLMDTTEGQKILSKDTSSMHSRWVRFFTVLLSSVRTTERRDVHYASFLEALIKFCPPSIRQHWSYDRILTEFLDECATSFVLGHFEDVESRGQRGELDIEAVLCIVMAPYPLHGWIRAFLSRLPPHRRARNATDVLRHIRYWWGKRGPLRDLELVEFHKALLADLLDLGASPYRCGPDFLRTTEADRAYTSHYWLGNAITDMCIQTFDAWRPPRVEHLWAEHSGWLAPAAAKKMFNQITKHSIVPDEHVTLEFFQPSKNPLILSTETNTMYRTWRDPDYSSYPMERIALRVRHLLVIEANLAYLIGAVASRAAHYEPPRDEISNTVEGDFGVRLAQAKPYAVVKYIMRTVRSKERDLGHTTYRINQGPCSQALLESITDLFYSRVQQNAAVDRRIWEESITLMNSNEAEQTSESIRSALAADRIGIIRREDWERENQAGAQQRS